MFGAEVLKQAIVNAFWTRDRMSLLNRLAASRADIQNRMIADGSLSIVLNWMRTLAFGFRHTSLNPA